MIANDLKIDFKKKIISLSGKKKKVYEAKQLYSYLMDLFDEPENMRYDIPMAAKSLKEFKLINGWTIDPDSYKYVKGSIV